MKKRICTTLAVITLVLFYTMPIFAQTDSKVAILTVSGSGKTKQEALNSALRNAIEQAFGTFISSNTQILDDKLTKDEIVSVSNGNIQEYTVISEVQTPDGNWSNTVKAKVAVDKLTSFCESKGVKVEFKGSLFSLNIKQQILNEENELKVIDNLEIVLKQIYSHLFDYKISTTQPTSRGGTWEVPVKIEANLNSNINQVSEYMFKTIKGISLTNEEVENYFSLKKAVYFVAFQPINPYKAELFALRSKASIDKISLLIGGLIDAMYSFTVYNNIENIQGEKLYSNIASKYNQIGSNERGININRGEISSINFIPVLTMQTKYGNIGNFFCIMNLNCINPWRLGSYVQGKGNYDTEFYNLTNNYFKFIKKWDFLYAKYTSDRQQYINYMAINLDNLKPGKSKAIITYSNSYSIDQIQKISEYKITPNYN